MAIILSSFMFQFFCLKSRRDNALEVFLQSLLFCNLIRKNRKGLKMSHFTLKLSLFIHSLYLVISGSKFFQHGCSLHNFRVFHLVNFWGGKVDVLLVSYPCKMGRIPKGDFFLKDSKLNKIK